jgi:2'-5' RNA ligase
MCRVVRTLGEAAREDIAVVDAVGSALIIPLSAAEKIVGGWRVSLDPSAAAGVPAHITIHFPWVPADQVDRSVLRDLEEMVAAVPRFDVVFERIGWFDREVLWLDPDPKEPFISMAAESAGRWPDRPQYGGQFEIFVPHLTVGIGHPDELDRAEARLAHVLPIHDVVTQVWWITRTGAERWVVRHTIDLG